MSITLLCWALGPQVWPLPSESQWTAGNLPRGCLGTAAARTLVPCPTLWCSWAPWVMSVTHVLHGDWILKHCSTESYILSSTHPWRLVKSLWLWMHKIPFLLHVECAVNIKWNFLICWLLPGAERKWVEDADEVTFLCLVYKDSQAHPGWILCSLHPWYPNCGPRTSRVGITQEPVKNTKSQAAPRPTLW